MKKFNSIIYVNYSPYENSGKILDYLLENFKYVFLFTLGFHNIKKKGKLNKLVIFNKGKSEKEYSLFQLSVPQSMLFIMLPLRSLITLSQIIFYSHILQRKFGVVDIFFSVNAFTSCIGIVLKRLGIVSKTVFWVWDYYPPAHRSRIITLVRKIYWYFDKWATASTDRVVVANERLLRLRQRIGIIPKKTRIPIISLGTEILEVNIKKKREVILGFIGVIKKSQGLGAVFSSADEIIRNFPDARFEVVGSGPDEGYFKEQAKNTLLPTTFHGYLEGAAFNNVLKKCTIGIAPYQPDQSNVAQFGDAGKVKRYLSLGLPVLITDVFEFSKKVEKSKAGAIRKYGNSKDLIEAIKKIMNSYKTYQKNSLNLGKKFYYKKIYPEMFKFNIPEQS